VNTQIQLLALNAIEVMEQKISLRAEKYKIRNNRITV